MVNFTPINQKGNQRTNVRGQFPFGFASTYYVYEFGLNGKINKSSKFKQAIDLFPLRDPVVVVIF